MMAAALHLNPEALRPWGSVREIARACGMSKSTLQRATKGVWPSTGSAAARSAIERALRQRGAAPNDLAALYTAQPKEVGPDVFEHTEAVPAPQAPVTATQEKEKDMLLQKVSITAEARKHFGLPRSPFVDDVQSCDDVFQTASTRYVRASLLDCALHQGFIGVIGESGAGKSTLAEDLEERIRIEGRDIAIIRPYVLAMEDSDAKGKPLRSGQIAEAVIRTLDQQASMRSSPDARFDQVHQLLKNSARSGRKHLILIEEAHCMPKATLKHLKRWLEIKDGMRRLVGVALIAQPELRKIFENAGPDLREVAQRCELIDLAPLDNDLEGYLRHKFARFDLKFEQVFAADAADAIRTRLIHTPRGGKPADTKSICYPLVVNNLVSRAMNAAAATGYPVVDGNVIAHC